MNEMLNIFDLCDATVALGPGTRFVVWVQGCPFDCKDCTSPYGRETKENILVDPADLAARIVGNRRVGGITLSGGEPMLQSAALAAMLGAVAAERPELDVIVYTGFRIEELNGDGTKSLLALTDLLIDGRYVEELNDDIGIRGSSNQRFHYLTDRLKPYREEMERGPRKLTLFPHRTADGEMHFVGIKNRKSLKIL
jgi:anaerobic ribonucleoside-triphosphate reductase activating protein